MNPSVLNLISDKLQMILDMQSNLQLQVEEISQRLVGPWLDQRPTPHSTEHIRFRCQETTQEKCK